MKTLMPTQTVLFLELRLFKQYWQQNLYFLLIVERIGS